MHHPTDRIAHTTAFVTPVVEHWLEREIAQWVHSTKDRSDDPTHHERTLLPRSYIPLLACQGSPKWPTDGKAPAKSMASELHGPNGKRVEWMKSYWVIPGRNAWQEMHDLTVFSTSLSMGWIQTFSLIHCVVYAWSNLLLQSRWDNKDNFQPGAYTNVLP